MKIEGKETSVKERVLLVHNYYQIGGGEHTVFENEKKLLRNNKHHVVVYTRDNAELQNSLLKRLFLPFTTVFSIKTYREVKKIIMKEQIDIVHCHNTFPLISPSVYYAAWKCGIPVLQTIHNFRFVCPNGVFYRKQNICEDCLKKKLLCGVRRKCYRNSHLGTLIVVAMLQIHRFAKTYHRIRYIYLTEFNREKFRNLLGEKVDEEFVKPNFEYIALPTEKKTRDGSYIYIGRLDKNKGIDFLLSNWDINRELYIFGTGELKEYVESTCASKVNLHYMGFRSIDTILEYLARSTAMIFPTDLYEGFPMTLIEAFAVGTPVICSDVGNGADIVSRQRAGVIYKRRDAAALMMAIKEIERDFEYYSKNAEIAYKSCYTPEANYRQIKSIYEVIRNGK